MKHLQVILPVILVTELTCISSCTTIPTRAENVPLDAEANPTKTNSEKNQSLIHISEGVKESDIMRSWLIMQKRSGPTINWSFTSPSSNKKHTFEMVMHGPKALISYHFSKLDGHPIDGHVAAHPIIGDIIFSPSDLNFWKMVKRDGKVIQGVSQKEAQSKIIFSTLYLPRCPHRVELAEYMRNDKIIGIVFSTAPAGQSPFNFKKAYFYPLMSKNALKEFKFEVLQCTINIQNQTLTGDLCLSPLKSNGMWVSPSVTFGEYLRVTNPEEKFIYRPEADAIRGGDQSGYDIFSSAELSSVCKSLQVDKNSWKVWPQKKGRLVFGRVVEPGKRTHRWQFNAKGVCGK